MGDCEEEKTSLREFGEKAGSHVRTADNRDEEKSDERKEKTTREETRSVMSKVYPRKEKKTNTNTRQWRFNQFHLSNSVLLGFL